MAIPKRQPTTADSRIAALMEALEELKAIHAPDPDRTVCKCGKRLPCYRGPLLDFTAAALRALGKRGCYWAIPCSDDYWKESPPPPSDEESWPCATCAALALAEPLADALR